MNGKKLMETLPGLILTKYWTGSKVFWLADFSYWSSQLIYHDKSPWTLLMFFVFSYVWSGFIVLLGIFLNVYSKNDAQINAWALKHGAKYSTYLSQRQKRTSLMENVWCQIFKMASVFFNQWRSPSVQRYGHVSNAEPLESGHMSKADNSPKWKAL